MKVFFSMSVPEVEAWDELSVKYRSEASYDNTIFGFLRRAPLHQNGAGRRTERRTDDTRRRVTVR